MHPAFTSTSSVHPLWNFLLGVIGGAAGGAAGYFVSGWLAGQGYYLVLLPGALLGLGCGGFIRRRSIPLAVVAGLAALALGVFIEWSHFPFLKDDSLEYFVRNVHTLPPVKLLLIALGGAAGFWFALGSQAKAVARTAPDAAA